MPTKKPRKFFHVVIGFEEHKKVLLLAKQRGTTLSGLIRFALKKVYDIDI